MPSDVLPPLVVIFKRASVKIDSDIKGFIISPDASAIPVARPSNNGFSSSTPSWRRFNKVLTGLPTTS